MCIVCEIMAAKNWCFDCVLEQNFGLQKDESLIHHDETLVKSWYKHNKQDAAAFIGGVAGLVVIGSFYSLMTAVRTSPSVSGAGYDAGSGNLGYNPEESVGLTGKRGSTDV